MAGKLRRQATLWFAALCAAYLGLAYFAAPEFWSFHILRDDLKPAALMTTTPDGIPGDPINVSLVGTEEDVIEAFAAAHWDRATSLSVKSDIKIGESVLLDRPDVNAPFQRCCLTVAARTSPSKNRLAKALTSVTTSASG